MSNMRGIFVDVIEKLYTMTDFEEARTFIVEHVKNSNIPLKDKRQILYNVEYEISSIGRLQQYITNSMLAFNKMRTK